MERIARIQTQFGVVEVELEVLAKNLNKAAEVAKELGLRPGQIIYDDGSRNSTSLERTFVNMALDQD